MANAIILHRRRSEKIEPGTQKFTANDTFTVPYSTVYTIVMVGSSGKAGNGGKGGDAIVEQLGQYYYIYGGGGGGGGGGQSKGYTVSFSITLKKGEKIGVTINKSIISFGSYASVATGTAAQNGTDASGRNIGVGGQGEGKHTVSAPSGWVASGTNSGISGGNGIYGAVDDVANNPAFLPGGPGGYAGTYNGGEGGEGGDYTDPEYLNGANGATGKAAVIGNIQISWGQ